MAKVALFTEEEIQELVSSTVTQTLKQYQSENLKVIHSQNETGDVWKDLKELCEYLPDKPKPATVYGWVNTGYIPYFKGKKKLQFLKSDIDAWLKSGRRKTTAELSTEADNYLAKKK